MASTHPDVIRRLIDKDMAICDKTSLEHDGVYMPVVISGPKGAGKSAVASTIAAVLGSSATFKSAASHEHTTDGVDVLRLSGSAGGVTVVDFEGQNSARNDAARDVQFLRAISMLVTGGVLVLVASRHFERTDQENLQAFAELIKSNTLMQQARCSLVLILRGGPPGLQQYVEDLPGLKDTLAFFDQVRYIEVPEHQSAPDTAPIAQLQDDLKPLLEVIHARAKQAQDSDAAKLFVRAREVLQALSTTWENPEVPIDTLREALQRGRVRTCVQEVKAGLVPRMAAAVPSALDCPDIRAACAAVLSAVQAEVTASQPDVPHHILDQEMGALREGVASSEATLLQAQAKERDDFVKAAAVTAAAQLANPLMGVLGRLRCNIAKQNRIPQELQQFQITAVQAVCAQHNPNNLQQRAQLLQQGSLRDIQQRVQQEQATLLAERDRFVQNEKNKHMVMASQLYTNTSFSGSPASFPISQFHSVIHSFTAVCGTEHPGAEEEVKRSVRARFDEVHRLNKDAHNQNQQKRYDAHCKLHNDRKEAERKDREQRAQANAHEHIHIPGVLLFGGGGTSGGCSGTLDISPHLLKLQNVKKVRIQVHLQQRDFDCGTYDFLLGSSSPLDVTGGGHNTGWGKKQERANVTFVPSTGIIQAHMSSFGWGCGGPSLGIKCVDLFVEHHVQVPPAPAMPLPPFQRVEYVTPALGI
eukprot:m.183867 g.183867  ORF g.183867 m.183867 type:complete len:699 (+) comp21533_c0_seq3:376-2472(+)